MSDEPEERGRSGANKPEDVPPGPPGDRPGPPPDRPGPKPPPKPGRDRPVA